MRNRTEAAGQAGLRGLEELLQQLIGAYRQSIDLFDAQIRAVINGNVNELEEGTSQQLEQQDLMQQLEARLRGFLLSHNGDETEVDASDSRPLRKVLEESGRLDLIGMGIDLVNVINRTLEKRDQLTGLLEFARGHTNEVIRMIYGSAPDGNANYTQKGAVRQYQATPMAINKRI